MKKMQSRKEGEKRVGKLKIERNAVNHRLLKARSENSSKAFAICLSALFPYMQNIILRTDRVLIILPERDTKDEANFSKEKHFM